MAEIDFWYSIGSTYSYLTILRIESYATRNDVHFRWHPFNVRAIMTAQNNIPFKNKPTKTAYMWRDIERRAAGYDLSPQLPAPYPLAALELANQVALLGMREGWGKRYTIEAYRRWFEDGQPAGSEPNLSESIRAAGVDPERVIAEANTPEMEAALAEQTLAAEQHGVFGSPCFVVEKEVFWGDDRLDDAVAWARRGSLKA